MYQDGSGTFVAQRRDWSTAGREALCDSNLSEVMSILHFTLVRAKIPLMGSHPELDGCHNVSTNTFSLWLLILGFVSVPRIHLDQCLSLG